MSKGIASPFRTANSSAGAGLAGTGGAGSGGAAATSGSLTVPVIVRQWYELGDLSLLLENSTVPLPLLTKSNIVRGIAEAVTYLHAQVGGPAPHRHKGRAGSRLALQIAAAMHNRNNYSSLLSFMIPPTGLPQYVA